MSKRTWGLLAVTALMAAACGNGGATETTDSPPTTTVDSTAPSHPDASDATTTTDAPEPSDDDTAPSDDEEGSAVVTVGDMVYQLSVSEEVLVPGTASYFPTRCDPDFWDAGFFWVIAVAESGFTLAQPGVSLTLSLPHDPNDPEPIDVPDFRLKDEILPVDYYIPTNDTIQFYLEDNEFDGDLGTWTVDGNRIQGEITLVTLDPVEYHTAQFDISCPDGES